MAALQFPWIKHSIGKSIGTFSAARRTAILGLLLSLALVCPRFVQPGHANMVPDPSFENGTGNWSLGDGNSSIDTETARTGSQSLKLINDGDGNSSSSTNHNAGQYRIGGVQPGVEYEYNVWVRGDNVTGVGPGGKPLAVIRWRDSEDNKIEKEMYLWAPYGTYGWRNDTIYLQSPPGAATVDISFRSWWDCLTGTTNWDDVSLVPRDLSHRGVLGDSYQAETASSMDGGHIESSETNFTGSGYLEAASDGAYLEWNNVSGGNSGGTRILSFRYALEGNAKDWEVLVNGISQVQARPLATGQINSWASSDWQVDLQPGDNTIRVRVITVTAGPLIDKMDVFYLPGQAPPASPPTITPDGGSFTDSVQVTLETSSPGAAIYYTTDGSTPTNSSTQYTDPLTLTADATVKAMATGAGYLDSEVTSADFTVTETIQGPFGGTAWPVPGTVQAEDYDTGGEGLAYHNTSAGNDGGSYRNEDVDIWETGDTGGGHHIGPNAAGEWVEYTVTVGASGQYSLDLRVATPDDDRTMHVEVDGTDVTGSVDIPNTGAWDAWQTAETTIDLTPGEHVLRLFFDAGGFNFNWMEISPIGQTVATPVITPNGGKVAFPMDVEISCATTGAKIYYTTDGATPTTGSTLYAGPLNLTAEATVKAFAVAADHNDSTVAAAAFTAASTTDDDPNDPGDNAPDDGNDGDTGDDTGNTGGGGGGGGCFLTTVLK